MEGVVITPGVHAFSPSPHPSVEGTAALDGSLVSAEGQVQVCGSGAGTLSSSRLLGSEVEVCGSGVGTTAPVPQHSAEGQMQICGSGVGTPSPSQQLGGEGQIQVCGSIVGADSPHHGSEGLVDLGGVDVCAFSSSPNQDEGEMELGGSSVHASVLSSHKTCEGQVQVCSSGVKTLSPSLHLGSEGHMDIGTCGSSLGTQSPLPKQGSEGWRSQALLDEDLNPTEPDFLGLLTGLTAEVVDALTQTDLSWCEFPSRFFEWLRLNLTQRQQASILCSRWSVTQLEDFPEIDGEERDRLIRDFEDFLFDVMCLGRPGRAERRQQRRQNTSCVMSSRSFSLPPRERSPEKQRQIRRRQHLPLMRIQALEPTERSSRSTQGWQSVSNCGGVQWRRTMAQDLGQTPGWVMEEAGSSDSLDESCWRSLSREDAEMSIENELCGQRPSSQAREGYLHVLKDPRKRESAEKLGDLLGLRTCISRHEGLKDTYSLKYTSRHGKMAVCFGQEEARASPRRIAPTVPERLALHVERLVPGSQPPRPGAERGPSNLVALAQRLGALIPSSSVLPASVSECLRSLADTDSDAAAHLMTLRDEVGVTSDRVVESLEPLVRRIEVTFQGTRPKWLDGGGVDQGSIAGDLTTLELSEIIARGCTDDCLQRVHVALDGLVEVAVERRSTTKDLLKFGFERLKTSAGRHHSRMVAVARAEHVSGSTTDRGAGGGSSRTKTHAPTKPPGERFVGSVSWSYSPHPSRAPCSETATREQSPTKMCPRSSTSAPSSQQRGRWFDNEATSRSRTAEPSGDQGDSCVELFTSSRPSTATGALEIRNGSRKGVGPAVSRSGARPTRRLVQRGVEDPTIVARSPTDLLVGMDPAVDMPGARLPRSVGRGLRSETVRTLVQDDARGRPEPNIVLPGWTPLPGLVPRRGQNPAGALPRRFQERGRA